MGQQKTVSLQSLHTHGLLGDKLEAFSVTASVSWAQYGLGQPG
jgi:hypothetical protein